MIMTRPSKVIVEGSDPKSGKKLGEFTTFIDPGDLKFSRATEPTTDAVPGAKSRVPRFKCVRPGVLKLNFILDHANLIEMACKSDSEDSIGPELGRLREATMKMGKEQRQPPVVKVIWGPFQWLGRVTEMNIDYMLFSPNGRPIRARVTLSMEGEENLTQ